MFQKPDSSAAVGYLSGRGCLTASYVLDNKSRKKKVKVWQQEGHQWPQRRLKSVEVAGCKELKNEWVGESEGFQGIRQRVGRERREGLQGEQQVRRESYFFFSYNDLSPIMSLPCFKSFNFLFYIIRPKIIWLTRPCLIRFLSASAAWIFILCSSCSVGSTPGPLHMLFPLEKNPPLPFKKYIPQRHTPTPLCTAFNLYKKLRHVSWYLA